MNVLLVSPYPPDPAPEANHGFHISEQLAKLGHSVHVLCKKGSIRPTQPGIVVHPDMSGWSWTNLHTLVRCIRKCQPDVVFLIYIGWVYNHHPMITFLPTFCRLVRPGVACVTQFEIIDDTSPRRSFGTRVIRKLVKLFAGGKGVDWLFGTLLRDSQRIIVLSSPHRDRLTQVNIDVTEKAVILPPPPLIRMTQGSPDAIRTRLRTSLGATESDFVISYWGYIYPGKGLEHLLHAFHSISARGIKARLVIIGGSLEITGRKEACKKYYDMVRALPNELGLGNKVFWTGSFTWDDDSGSQYLYAADLCVLPFDYGVTLNNSSFAAASRHGIPVISTELPKGQDETLQHGRNIYLCPPRNHELLAEAITLLYEDSALRERLAQGALSLAREHYTWETTTLRVAAVCEAAIADVRGARTGTKPVCGADDSRDVAQQDTPDHSPLTFPQYQPTLNSARVTAPLVSVVVAVHNVDRYLSQCLDALANQTLEDIEIIVVNDASTDDSADIIDQYSSRYRNIKVITCARNKGLATVRNIGLRATSGDYVAFADGDDWVDIRMCEVLHRKAGQDRADVVIADATVFYEDSKTFRPFFDQHVRQQLDAALRSKPFALTSEPSVLLLEPVAWPKLYRRAFLRQHCIEFEDGMNSYEDICFHFSVLLKAERISLLDDKLFFYRQNRPGQISGRTNRKIFEVFDVFKKIHENLTAWKATPEVWAMLAKIELRQFNWLLKDRVQGPHKKEFVSLASKKLREFPQEAIERFIHQSTSYEISTFVCLKNNWLIAYGNASRSRWGFLSLWKIIQRDGPVPVAQKALRHGREVIVGQVRAPARRLLHKAINTDRVESVLRGMNEKVDSLVYQGTVSSFSRGEPIIEVCRISGETLFISRPPGSLLGDARWRVENDYYLSQTAIFRPGDLCIDVGAHLGLLSLYLAKKYPFITVYSLEPDPVTYDCLICNIELNRLTNIVAINKGVSGDGGKKTLYVKTPHNGEATISPRVGSTYHLVRMVNIETTTLNQLFFDHSISYCRLLKITAPGAVRESLEGLNRRDCVDLLCGEADTEDCNRLRLEIMSWKIARQHFWRTTSCGAGRTMHHWIQRMPSRMDHNYGVTGRTQSIPPRALCEEIPSTRLPPH